MRIIAKHQLRDYGETHPDTEQALKAWFENAETAIWKKPNDIERDYRNASIVGGECVVFNIRGNHYCLVVAVDYEEGVILIKWLGTRREYVAVKVEKLERYS